MSRNRDRASLCTPRWMSCWVSCCSPLWLPFLSVDSSPPLLDEEEEEEEEDEEDEEEEEEEAEEAEEEDEEEEERATVEGSDRSVAQSSSGDTTIPSAVAARICKSPCPHTGG